MPRERQFQQDEMEQLLQKLLKQQQENTSSLNSDDDSDDCNEEEDFSDDEGSVCSMPEIQDLQRVVFSRYEKYHPKSLIPDEEKLITLYLREFNDAFCDLEEEFEEEEDEISHELLDLREDLKGPRRKKKGASKKSTINYIKKKKEEITFLERKQKESKRNFLKKKDELERFYSQMCTNAIQQHPNPPSELTSILTLLEKNASTLHAICLHLSHFSYIDSELEEGSDAELPSMNDDSESEEDMPTLPNLTQETLDFQFGDSNKTNSSASLDSEDSENELKKPSSSSTAT